eukprot:3050541-Prymnesium_polylepis.2
MSRAAYSRVRVQIPVRVRKYRARYASVSDAAYILTTFGSGSGFGIRAGFGHGWGLEHGFGARVGDWGPPWGSGA